MKKNGFTLIELMIVVAIVGILAAIAIPNFLKFQCLARLSKTDYTSDQKHLICDANSSSRPGALKPESVAALREASAEVDDTTMKAEVEEIEEPYRIQCYRPDGGKVIDLHAEWFAVSDSYTKWRKKGKYTWTTLQCTVTEL